jgi:kynurenine formamidase
MLPTQGTTHVDGLAHMWSGGKLYNGFSYREVRSSGTGRLGVEKLGGLVTTAHLLDCTDRPDDARLEVGVADLDARFADGRPQPGDALLLHTGWMQAALAGTDAGRDFPVLSPDAAEWIADHDLAIVGADNIAVEATGRRGVLPPLHKVLVCDLGVTLVELLRLDEPVAAGVRSGILVIAPLRISRGVGSPVNPLLIA